MTEEIKKHFSAMGKKGGKANKHQGKGGKAAWAKLAPEERTRITSARAKKAWETKRAKAKRKGNNQNPNCILTVTDSPAPTEPH